MTGHQTMIRSGRRFRITYAVVLVLIGSVHLLGCSEDLTSAPPVELPFTLFGVVNPTADTQAVIVYPVESGALRPIGPEPLDAVVRSTDMQTGEVRAWRDSVVSDGESGFSHIFWADFRAEFGREYEIEAVRSDGSESTSTVSVPRQVSIEETDDGTSRMHVAFRGGPFRLVQLELTYSVGIAGGRAQGCPTVPRPFHYTFSYAGEEIRQEDGWDLVVDLEEYVQLIINFMLIDTRNFELFADPRTRPALVALTLDVTIGDEAWELPRGFLDRRILSHPRTLTNVQNGLGFIGGGYKIEKRLFPSRDAVEDADFYDYLEGRAGC